MLFTALGLAEVYSRPGIRAAVDAGGFTPQALLDGSGTLCIVTPSAEGDRFAPYFTNLLTAIIHTAETRAAQTSVRSNRGSCSPSTKQATYSVTHDSLTCSPLHATTASSSC